MKYDVTIIVDATTFAKGIEADDPKDALDKAIDEVGSPTLCNQCANQVDTGDAIGGIVYNESGEVVYDTTDYTQSFELITHLHRQREFSERTFGPGARTAGVIDHIRKELVEIEENPLDASEWIDVIILGFDGAWRAGHTPQQIIDALVAKQTKNEGRTWPDWRTADTSKAIEHDRSKDVP